MIKRHQIVTSISTLIDFNLIMPLIVILGR